MKKTFLFLAAAIFAVGLNAETVFSWADNIGSITATGTTDLSEKVRIKTDTEEVPAILFKNGYSINSETNEHLNYVELSIEGGFKANDAILIEFCYYNNDEKVATVGIYNTAGSEIAVSSNGINAKKNDGLTSFNYILTEDMDVIRIARAKTGKTNTYIVTLSVVRGEEVAKKALTPQFSVASGTKYEAFKVAITSTETDAVIYYSLNGAEYVEYTDSILVDDFDNKTIIEAYATKEGAENSDIAKVEYTLSHFVPRPIFNARKTIELGGITAADFDVISGNVEFTTRSMDGAECPVVVYKLPENESEESTMVLALKQNPEFTLRFKNSSAKNPALTCAMNYLQFDGKNVEMWLDDVRGGDTIVFVVTAKGSSPTFSETYSSTANLEPYQPEDYNDPCFTDGEVMTASDASVDNDFEGWSNLVYIVAEGKKSIKLKETANGARIAKIQIGAYRGEATGLNDTEALAPAVTKVLENGQIYIIKDGVKYNLLGAQVAE